MSKGQSMIGPKDKSISMRINGELYEEAVELYGKMGLSLSDVINVFFAVSVNVGGLPFELKDSLKDEVRKKANTTLRKEIQKGLKP